MSSESPRITRNSFHTGHNRDLELLNSSVMDMTLNFRDYEQYLHDFYSLSLEGEVLEGIEALSCALNKG